MLTTITLNSGGNVYGTLAIESSVDSAVGSEGLFSFLPVYVSIPLIGIVLLSAVVLALRMKKSGELTDSGEELVAPDAFVNPDHLGTRREDALDIGYAVDELASGEVSSDEIAAALAQSLQMPSPAPATVPLGLPPVGMPPQSLPLGLPPAGLPPKPVPALPLPQPIPTPAPLPPVSYTHLRAHET